MRELILVMGNTLLDKPDEVQIREIEGDLSIIFEIRIAKEDLRKFNR